ncbi:hypothetical protein [Propionibacterium ruminifibrarum]|uniref:hypothetical protein n=1 Tax=Propionibacterium ruminifibrarum TaxID=1962131 RepID=UPI0011C38D92|nr:hypothetical protein [Propionibacterium ruminifibrarum]
MTNLLPKGIIVVVNEALRDLLTEAQPGMALDGLVTKAKQSGIRISRNTIARARRGDLVNPTETTLQALAQLFGIDVRRLREVIGRRPGERGLGPWTPDPRSASLTQAQREALDRLIVTIVEQQQDDVTPKGEVPLHAVPDWADPIAARTADRTTDRVELDEEDTSQDPDDWEHKQ